MKTLMALSMLVFVSAGRCLGDPVLGDQRESVLEQMGPPRGRIQQGTVETLLYDRGLIDLTSGVVTRVKLITDERLQAKRAAQAEADRIAAEEQQRRRQLAEDAKARMLADPAYMSSSTSNRLARWEQLRAEHPDVVPTAEYNELESQAAAQQQATALSEGAPDEEEAASPRMSASKRRKLHRSQRDTEGAERPLP